MIVIPMGGLSRRFQLAGYTMPKYMLPLSGGTVFDHAVSSFKAYFESERFVFVVRPEEGVASFVHKRIRGLGITSYDIVQLKGDTRGQAETVRIGIEESSRSPMEPVAIFNIDTIRPNAAFPPFFQGPLAGQDLRGYVEVFRAEGDGWSFVVPNEQRPGHAASVVEKVRLSELCCTGLYWFATAKEFLEAYAKERVAPSQQVSEDYVAPIFNQLIKDGLPVGWLEVPGASVIPCGVPAEYEALT